MRASDTLVYRIDRLHGKLRTDGYDCGDGISALLSDFLGESDTRMVMYSDELFTERVCKPEESWWMNNSVPKRVDDVAYQDLAPYVSTISFHTKKFQMIQTEGSLRDLNSRLEEDVGRCLTLNQTSCSGGTAEFPSVHCGGQVRSLERGYLV